MCHFVNEPFCQCTILSTCLFVIVPFNQFDVPSCAMSSICCFNNMPFPEYVICHFANMPFCHCAIFSKLHLVNLPFNELTINQSLTKIWNNSILSICYFINAPFILSMCHFVKVPPQHEWTSIMSRTYPTLACFINVNVIFCFFEEIPNVADSCLIS